MCYIIVSGYVLMKNLKPKHYVDTVIYSIDMIIKNIKAELRQRADELDMGITSGQFAVLDTISAYKGIYQQKLSAILYKDKSNTNRLISVLLERGLITKDVSKINNRLVNILNVSEKGQELLDKYMPQAKEIIRDICSNITDEEVDNLHMLSKKFQKDLNLNTFEK